MLHTAYIPHTTLGIGFGNFGWSELLVLAVIGVLIFGKRLPEVGKSLGKGIVEFKKGLSGIDDDVRQATSDRPRLDKPRDTEAHTATSGAEQPLSGESTHKSV